MKKAAFTQNIIFTAGSGGTGKSFILRILVSWLTFLQEVLDFQMRIIDADEKVKRDLWRFFPGHVQFANLTTHEEAATLFSELIRPKDKPDICLVDLKGDQQRELREAGVFTPDFVQLMRERYQLATTLLLPVTQMKPSSFSTAVDYANLFGDAATLIVVENNMGRPINEAEAPAAYKKFITERKPLVLRLDPLETSLAAELELHNATILHLKCFFDRDTGNVSEEDLKAFGLGHILTSPVNCAMLSLYWEKVAGRLDTIRHVLLPERVKQKGGK